LQSAVLAKNRSPFLSQLRQFVVGPKLLVALLGSLRGLGAKAAAAIPKKDIEPAVAIPIDDARFRPHSPVTGPTLVVVPPAERTFGDESPSCFQLWLVLRTHVAIPDDAAISGPHQQVELAVAIPVGRDRGS